MPVKKRWTPNEDASVRLWCSQGLTWTEQALRIGVHRDTVLARAHLIGVKLAALPVEEPPVEERLRRSLSQHSGGDAWLPLPAGHPISWGALTRGTWLDGTRYPALSAV